jgi:hypothetical protein
LRAQRGKNAHAIAYDLSTKMQMYALSCVLLWAVSRENRLARLRWDAQDRTGNGISTRISLQQVIIGSRQQLEYMLYL